MAKQKSPFPSLQEIAAEALAKKIDDSHKDLAPPPSEAKQQQEIAAEALVKKIEGFHKDLATALSDAKQQKASLTRIMDQALAIIDLPGFGIHLDVAESVYRLIRIHGPKCFTPEAQDACIEKIFEKISAYENWQHIYTERYFHTQEMPLETNEFSFRVMMDKAFQAFLKQEKVSTKQLIDLIKEGSYKRLITSINTMLFEHPPAMQKYIVELCKTHYGLDGLTIPDAKQDKLSQAELVSRADSPVFSPIPERKRNYDMYDLTGKRKPEEPLLLHTDNPEAHQDSDDEEDVTAPAQRQ